MTRIVATQLPKNVKSKKSKRLNSFVKQEALNTSASDAQPEWLEDARRLWEDAT